jgi:hypothetical protein
MAGVRRLGVPRRIAVQAGPGGVPTAVALGEVDAVNEDWVVEDRWWTGKPLRRRYFELVLVNGRNTVVFFDLNTRRWFVQRS